MSRHSAVLVLVLVLVAVAAWAPEALAAGETVTRLTLIDADRDAPVAGFDPLPDGATLDLTTLPTRALNIDATTSPTTVGSVVFVLDGTRMPPETDKPYALAGNTGSDYKPWTPAAGRHTLTVTPYSGPRGTGTAGTPRTTTFTVVAQAPWTAPVALPGTLKAEEYDRGGAGVAYADADAVNQPGAFRATEGVDVQPGSEGGGFEVGHIRAGEWLEYTVDVPSAATYDIGIRFASASAGGRAHVELGGRDVTGPMALPRTGGWATWQTVWRTGVALPATDDGVLRLAIDASTSGGDVGNVDSIVVRASTPAAAPVWPASFASVAPAPAPRYEGTGAVVGSKLYVFGGYRTSRWAVDRSYASYDPATNAWTTLGTLPVGMPETHVEAAVDGTAIYLAGGFGGDIQDASPSQWISDQVWRFETTTNTWTLVTHLPQPRGAGTLKLVDGKLHYISGNSADRVTNEPDHFVFDLATSVWSTAAPMPDPKDHFASAVVAGKIYTMGGEHGHDVLRDQQRDVHVYDPATDTWTALAPMPVAVSHDESGTYVRDGRIVMAGGQIADSQPTAGAWSYDPATDRWTTLSPSLPAPRQGAVVLPVGDRLVVALGATLTSEPQAGVWLGAL